MVPASSLLLKGRLFQCRCLALPQLLGGGGVAQIQHFVKSEKLPFFLFITMESLGLQSQPWGEVGPRLKSLALCPRVTLLLSLPALSVTTNGM